MKQQEQLFLRSSEPLIRVIIPAAGEPRNQESLEPLLQDIPLAMLDINGKPLLQRNVETLNKCKLYDISVITGYKNEAFKVKGVNYFHNSRYQSEHIMTSIMCAKEKLDSKTLFIYSDILVEKSLIERLKPLEADFIIVIDNSFSKLPERNKKLDLVITEEELVSEGRILTYDHLYPVKSIGSVIQEEASAEFTGIAMCSEKGAEIFRKEYQKALKEYSNKPFFEAENISQSSLPDFLQYLIELGYEIKALQVNSCWMEIHTFENYRKACSLTKIL